MSPRAEQPWCTSWHVAGGSSTGVAHLKRGLENQDAFGTNLAELRDPTREWQRHQPLIVAVADGLGSGRFAAAGSSLAAALARITTAAEFPPALWQRPREKLLVERMCGVLTETSRRWTHSVQTAITPALGTESADALEADFRTTLIVAVIKPPWLVVGHIGDGLVAARTRDELRLLDRDRRAETEIGLVDYLAPGLGQARVQAYYDEALDGIAIATDGLEDAVLSEGPDHQLHARDAFFEPLFNEVGTGVRDSEGIMRLLRSPQLREVTQDDLTLVVCARPPIHRRRTS